MGIYCMYTIKSTSKHVPSNNTHIGIHVIVLRSHIGRYETIYLFIVYRQLKAEEI